MKFILFQNKSIKKRIPKYPVRINSFNFFVFVSKDFLLGIYWDLVKKNDSHHHPHTLFYCGILGMFLKILQGISFFFWDYQISMKNRFKKLQKITKRFNVLYYCHQKIAYHLMQFFKVQIIFN